MPLIQESHALFSFKARSHVSGAVHSDRGMMDRNQGKAFEVLQQFLNCIQCCNQGSDNGK